MFDKYILILLLGHIIGDFYAQTEEMAENKEKEYKWVVKHCLCYAISVFVVSIPFISFELVGMAVIVSILHFLIDSVKFFYLKMKSLKKKFKEAKNVFLVDQGLHLCCLIVVAYIMTVLEIDLIEKKFLVDFFNVIGLSEMQLSKWVLSLLLVHKPANILIQKLISSYKPMDIKNELQTDKNAGRFIGSIERIIMLILISLGQYAAIGLVMTAKSIARYDKIAGSKNFAEYYLLGTLLSVAIVIVCATFVLKVN